MSSVKYTIVIPSYNHSLFLRDCILSALNQTYEEEFEIIVYDDNSSDNSADIIKALFIQSNERFKYIISSSNSGGYVQAMNIAIQLVKSKFFIVLQCDDKLHPDYLKEIDKITNPMVNMYFTSSTLISEDGEQLALDYELREQYFQQQTKSITNLIKPEILIKLLTYSCIIPNISAVTFATEFYKKNLQLKSDYSIAADWEFYLDFALLNESVIYLKKPLNFFRQHSNTIRSKEGNFKMIIQILDIFSKRKKKLLKKVPDFILYSNIAAILLHNLNLIALIKIIPDFKEKMELGDFKLFQAFYLGFIKLIREKISRLHNKTNEIRT